MFINGVYNRLHEKWFPFLMENQPKLKDVVVYLVYILAPVLLILLAAFFIAVKREVRRKTGELKAANEAKSRFLANMSHELRTPLNAILGYSALLQKDAPLPAQASNSLQIINKSGAHLLSLINDILEIAKIESQKAVLNIAAFDFHQFIGDIEAMFAMEARMKGLALTVKGLQSVPRHMAGDALKLRIVLINLIGNALKFTREGGVTVTLSSQDGLKGKTLLYVQVKDTGIGIAEQEREKLFEAFTQTRSGLDAQKGTGLGLAISQEFVTLMGGRIHVESTVDGGSTFYFSVELADSGAPEAPGVQKAGKVTGIKPEEGKPCPLVLIAEDNADSRRLMARLITGAGFSVLEAEDGQAAVNLAREHRPGFIWMDIRMPGMSGLKAAGIIKSLAPDYSPVIAAISANVFEEEREMILASGCDDLVRKPFAEDDIWAVMEKHLPLTFLREPDAPRQLSLRGLLQEDRAALRAAILRLDEGLMAQAVSKIRETAPETADRIAVEISQMRFTLLLRQLNE